MQNELPEPDKIKCPKCGSTQITAGKHGFSAGKAVGGALLTGGIGLLAGLHGSKKIEITCLNCGNKFKPGDNLKQQEKKAKASNQVEGNAFENISPLGCVVLILIGAAILYFLSR